MNETLLTWLVFILAFGGMVIIHEFGHYIVARLCKIEVEEFGIGLPTPGALTYWISRGYLLLKSGKHVEIPQNFRLPVGWNSLVDREAKITADQVENRWVMRSIEVLESEYSQASSTSQKFIKAGKGIGATELVEVISEVHPGTRFTLNWLPLGGFVRPKGENDPNIQGGLAAANPWKRLAVLFAGPLMNLLAAVVIYGIIFNRVGVPDTSRVLVTGVLAESPAAQAGFRDGDIFISGNDKPIGSYDDLRLIVDGNENKPVAFLVNRRGQEVELIATPAMNEQEERIMIGVQLSVPFKATDSWLETFSLGAQYTYYNSRALISLPAQLIRGSLAPEQGRIIGLKGIYDILQQSVSHDVQAGASSEPVSTNPVDQPVRTLELLASLTISLGIFNLFPFPALDGGRIIFVLPELIFRRRVPHQLENLVHGLGMAFLLAFMVYVNVMDFVNPVSVIIP